MKAYILNQYGSTQDLKLSEIDEPEPQNHEVKVKIKVAAINDYEWSLVRGRPVIYRLLFGVLKPKNPIPGMEFSGVVESCGSTVKSFKVGDAVFCDSSDYKFGSLSEYIPIDEKALIKKNESLNFQEAAALSHAGSLAYQALHDYGTPKDGDRILMNGAGGGVGSLCLQLARRIGDYTIHGVDTGNKLERMKELGFDEVFDYKKVNIIKNKFTYDWIIDTKTNRSPFQYARILNENGNYITVGGKVRRLLQHLIFRKIQGKRFRIVSLKTNQSVEQLLQLHQQQAFKFVLDEFPFDKVPEAIQYFGEGKHQGKVVINIE